MPNTHQSDTLDFSPIDVALPERHDKVKDSDARHKKSKFDEPIRRDDGGPHGQSRMVGDVDAQTRHAIISLLIDEAVRRGHSLRDIAYLLLIARVESGFNPDAASTGSSASGVMQITDVTADDIDQVTSRPAWIQANPRDAQIDISNSSARFNARKNVVAGIIQFERAKAKALAWAQTHDVHGLEARLYQYYHYGLYLNDAREDRVGLNTYTTLIAPLMDKVEAALKTQARFQVQLKQPNGLGFANAMFAAIVPKDAAPKPPAPHSEPQGVTRLFADLWAHLQIRSKHEGSSSQPRTPAVYDHAPIAALKKAHTTATASPSSALPREHASGAGQSGAAHDAPTEATCTSYPLRVQDAQEFEVVFGRTDGQGLTPVFTLSSVGEIQFFVLNDDYPTTAKTPNSDAPTDQAETSNSPKDAEPTSAGTDKPSEAPDVAASQTPTGESTSPPQTGSPTDSPGSAINESVASSSSETQAGGPVAFGSLSSLYAPRTPSLEQAYAAFRKHGKPFDSTLFEYSRSFVCKPPRVFEQVSPKAASVPPKVQIAEVTASITSKETKPKSTPAAQVTTTTTNAQASVTGVAATPWMDIALQERANGVMQVAGTVRASTEGRKLFDEIKTAAEEYAGCQKKISEETRRSAKQRDQALITDLKQKAAEAKRKVDAGMARMVKLEADPSINNPRIIEYLSATRLAGGMHAQHSALDDEISWCASFVSWCLQKAGYKPVATGSDARAEEWSNYGQEAKEGEYGAIVVLQMLKPGAGGARSPSGRHVGFLVSEGQDKFKQNIVKLLGGNQKYEVGGDTTGALQRGSSVRPRVSITSFALGRDANIVARRKPGSGDKK